jgi:F0F1-type ATP synthase assembly protein I
MFTAEANFHTIYKKPRMVDKPTCLAPTVPTVKSLLFFAAHRASKNDGFLHFCPQIVRETMTRNTQDDRNQLGKAAEKTIEWAARIIAVCAIMTGIVWGGMQLDAKLKSKWFTPIGLICGISFGMVGLLLVVKRMEFMSQEQLKKEAQERSNATSSSNQPADSTRASNNSSDNQP